MSSSSSTEVKPTYQPTPLFEFELKEVKKEDEEKKEQEQAAEEALKEDAPADDPPKEDEEEQEEEEDEVRHTTATEEQKEPTTDDTTESSKNQPPEPLSPDQVNEVFARLPEETRMAVDREPSLDQDENPFMPREQSVQIPSGRRSEMQFPPPASSPKSEAELERERKEQQAAEWNRRKRDVAQAKREFDKAFMSEEQRKKADEKDAKERAKQEEKEEKARKKAESKKIDDGEKRRLELEAKLADAKAAAALQLEREAQLRRTLFVEHYTPEGWQISTQVERILITFNHPLLDEDDDDLDHLEWRPTISPSPVKEGEWKLDGKNTLAFLIQSSESDPAWLKSTEYTICIPKGVRALSGEEPTLKEDFAFSFKTPAIKVISSSPPTPIGRRSQGNNLPLDPTFLVIFDQFISPEDVMKTITIHAGTGLDWKKNPPPYGQLQLLDRDSKGLQDADEEIRNGFFDPAVEGRSLAFTCKRQLAHDSNYTLKIGPKTPSTEGPLTTFEPYVITFKTIPEFRIDRVWMNMNDLVITFNQSIVPVGGRYSTEHLSKLPEIIPDPPEGGSWIAEDRRLTYSTPTGAKWQNATEYQLMLPASLPSLFGAQLSKEKREQQFSTATNEVDVTLPASAASNVFVSGPLAVAFRQKIVGCEERVLSTIRIYTSKIIKTNYAALRLLGPDEIQDWRRKWSALDVFLNRYGEEYCIVFASTKKLPHDSAITLSIGPKIPSAEGELVNERDYAVVFHTTSPFSIALTSPVPKQELALQSQSPISIKFTQPIALASGGTDDLKWLPIIDPSPEDGEHWILADGQTLEYHPKRPWNHSTQYTVTVPAEAVSLWEDTLGDEYTFSFTSALIRVKYTYPKGGSGSTSSRQPIILIGFDQEIEPEDAIKCVSVNTSRWVGSSSEVRLLTEEEVDESLEVQGCVREKGRYLACQPVEPFRYEDQVAVKIGPKMPSAEGSALSPHQSSFNFTVVSSFVVTDYSPTGEHDAASSIIISFNHPLAPPQDLDMKHVTWRPTISPIPPDGEWSLSSNGHSLIYDLAKELQWPKSTTIKIKVDAGVKCAYNEPLEKKLKFSFSTPRVEIMHTFPAGGNRNNSVFTPMAIIFNQRVNAEQVLSLVSLSLGQDGFLNKLTKKTYASVELLSKEEVERDTELQVFLTNNKAEEGCWIAFRCIRNFLHDSSVTVKIDGNIRSEEGPLISTQSQSYTFRTCPRFGLLDGGEIVLTKRTPITLSFNQPLMSPHVTADINQLVWRPTISPPPERRAELCSWRKDLARVDYDYTADVWMATWLPEHVKKGGHQAAQALKELSTITLPYYEARVVELAKSGAISVGVAHRSMNLKGEMVGWSASTYGYHSDDGFIFHNNPHEGQPGQPTWGVGDVIGVGIDQNTVYWTKNGDRVAAKELDEGEGPLYPSVALDCPGVVCINLGDSPFVHPPGNDAKTLKGKKKAKKQNAKDKKEKSKKKSPRDKNASDNKEAEVQTSSPRNKTPRVEAPHVNEDITQTEKGKQKVSEEEPQPEQSTIVLPSTGWSMVNAFTLTYTPPCDWPASNIFTVKVPAGAISYFNEPLENDYQKEYKSNTAMLSCASTFSGDAQVLDPAIALCFDQRIDPSEVVKYIHVSASQWRFKSVGSVALVSDDEVKALRETTLRMAPWLDDQRDHCLVFRCSEAFPPNTTVTVKIDKIPSLEGPLLGLEKTFAFRTVTALKVTGPHYGSNNWGIVSPIHLRFNQPLVFSVPPKIEDLPWRPTVEPEPEDGGEWRFVESSALVYHPSSKWNRSTEYSIKVPAGVGSAYGDSLSQEYVTMFRTSTISPVSWFPTAGGQRRDCGMFVKFDQYVDPEEVLSCIKVTSGWRSTGYPIRLMSMEEVNASPFWRINTPRHEGFWVAFKPVEYLAGDATITVRIGPNIPSAEGPLKSTNQQSFTFRTVPEFKIVKFHPRNNNIKIYPGAEWLIRFSNRINTSSLDLTKIKVTPHLPDLVVTVRDKTLSLRSSKHTGDTVYKIEVDYQALRDNYGQCLGMFRGEDAEPVPEDGTEPTGKIEWEVKVWEPPRPRALRAIQTGIIVYDPVLVAATKQAPTYRIKVFNYKELRVCLYKLNPRKHYAKWGSEPFHLDVSESKSETYDYLGFGKLVYDEVVAVPDYVENEYLDFLVDLTPALKDAKRHIGQVGVVVTPTAKGHYPNRWRERDIIKAWIQCTHIGLDAFQSLQSVHVWATHLVKGGTMKGVHVSWHERKSVMGAQLLLLPDKKQIEKQRAYAKSQLSDGSLSPRGNFAPLALQNCVIERKPPQSVTTNKEGMATLANNNDKRALLVAKKGKDCAFLPDVWTFPRLPSQETLLWHVFDDRSMYRPKEEVSIKGYVRFHRRVAHEHFEKLEMPKMQKVIYRLVDSRSAEITKGEFFLTGLATFHFTVMLPDNINLGGASIHMHLEEHEGNPKFEHVHHFQIQEFRRPEFIAEAEVETKTPIWFEASALLKAKGSYYAGGALADSDITWTVSSTSGTFAPPGFLDYVFTCSRQLTLNQPTVLSCQRVLKAKTRESGEHKVLIEFKGYPDPPCPVSLAALIEIVDINRKSISTATQLILHPSLYYVGLHKHTDEPIPNEPFIVDIVVADHDGTMIENVDITIQILAVDGVRKVLRLEMIKSGKESVQFAITPNAWSTDFVGMPGPFELYSIVQDPHGRKHAAMVTFSAPKAAPTSDILEPLASPSDASAPANKLERVEEEKLIIVADKASYRIGETATLTLTCPFAPCDALVTSRCRGIVKTRTVRIHNLVESVSLPIIEDYSPNITIQVDIVGLTERLNVDGRKDNTAPPRPALATANIILTVPPLTKKLLVEVHPHAKKVVPGGETTIGVKVTDHAGSPAAYSEVCLIVVDESVLALSGYALTDPIDTFYPKRPEENAAMRFANRKEISVEQWDHHKLDPPTLFLEELKAEWSDDEGRYEDPPGAEWEGEAFVEEESLVENESEEEEMLEEKSNDWGEIECSYAGGLPGGDGGGGGGAFGGSRPSSNLRSRSQLENLDIQSSYISAEYFEDLDDRRCELKAESLSYAKKSKKKGGFALPMPSMPSFGGVRSSAAPAPIRQASLSRRADMAMDKKESRRRKSKAAPARKCDEAEAEECEADFSDADGDEDTLDEPAPLIAVRSNFNPLANFTPAVQLGEDGVAEITVKVPDNLTRYRIWAIAASHDGLKYGLGESLLTAQLPLVVRCSPPRFLNFGDRCELTVIIQNQLDEPLNVLMGVRTSEHTEIVIVEEGEHARQAGYHVQIPKEGRRMLSIPIKVTKPGLARFQVTCFAGKYGDAADVEFPIYPPATTESFAFYGTLAQPNDVVLQTIVKPSDALPQYGVLEISASSTMLQGLLDAAVYLYSYPYECSEQISSKLLALVALRDALDMFKSPSLPKKSELKNLVAEDLKRLKKRQQKNGGLGMWQHSHVNAFLTCHVAHCAAYCKTKGYSLPWFFEGRLASFLKDEVPRLVNNSRYDSDYADITFAYALYARYRLSPSADIKKETEDFFLRRTADGLPIEALGLMLTALADTDGKQKRSPYADELVRYLITHIKVDDEMGTAHVPSFYDELTRHEAFHSNYRVDAILLEALVVADPENVMISKLVKSLLSMRRNGIWHNTQENCWALLALDRYFTVFEKTKPDYNVRFWLAEQYCGETIFKGHTTDTRVIKIPMPFLNEAISKTKNIEIGGGISFGGGSQIQKSALISKDTEKKTKSKGKSKKGVKEEPEAANLIIQKDGPGRLYYRLGLSYAPKSLEIAALQRGFTVERQYTSQDKEHPEFVTRDNDGVWRIKKGAVIRAKLTVTTKFPRFNIALVDKLPGGLEAENPALKTNRPVSDDDEAHGGKDKGKDKLHDEADRSKNSDKSTTWFEHQNLRDERVECFAAELKPDTYVYEYTARAITPGRFIVPPAKIEEMYDPDVFGQSSSDVVLIE